jgi:hypothetical protein
MALRKSAKAKHHLVILNRHLATLNDHLVSLNDHLVILNSIEDPYTADYVLLRTRQNPKAFANAHLDTRPGSGMTSN